MKTKILMVAFLLAVTSAAEADFLGIYGGVGYWDSESSGQIIGQTIDLQDDLNLSNGGGYHLWIAFEHPVPVLPNIKIAHTNIEDSGDGTLTKDFEFQGIMYTVDQDVHTEIDLTHTDLTLYYELIDIAMDLDIGVTARWLDAEVNVQGVSDSVDIVLPALYVSAKVGLPFTGTYFGGDVNYIGYGGDKLLDYTVKVGWETENFILPEFGIELGYRSYGAEIDSFDFDIEADGVFLNLTAHF
ncbi:MAG: TIGR04219 family outer membrane beta-barrel protein [bacterium]